MIEHPSHLRPSEILFFFSKLREYAISKPLIISDKVFNAVVSTGNLGCAQGGHSSSPARITRYALISPPKNIASVTINISMPTTPLETGDLACLG